MQFMKYQRLTKEQLEELHPEFINFLATQSIDKKEWDDIKRNKPKVAEQELDVFSDLIWEGVLNNTTYLDHVSKNQMFLFYFHDDNIKLITVKSDQIDFTVSDSFKLLQEQINDDHVELFTAQKNYSNQKNSDKFALIQQGAAISKGEMYKALHQFINT